MPPPRPRGGRLAAALATYRDTMICLRSALLLPSAAAAICVETLQSRAGETGCSLLSPERAAKSQGDAGGDRVKDERENEEEE